MKGRFNLLLSVFLMCLVPIGYAEVSDESLNKVLDLSGIIKQVNQFPELIKSGMEQAKQQGTPVSDDDHNAMLSFVDQLVVPTEMVAKIRTSLNESLSEEEAKHLLAWYETKLGREITEAEEKASTPAAYQEMMQSAESLMQDLDRLEYAMRIDMELGLTRMTMDLQEQTGIAVYSAVMSSMQPGGSLDLEPLKAKMKAERAQTREAIKEMVLLSIVYSYKDLELEKLKQYEAFLKHPVTKKFIKLASKSMNHELKTSVSKITNAIVMRFKDRKEN